MLDQMRGAAKSWVSKLLLGLLGVSFLVWGVPNSFLPQIGGGKIFSSGDSSLRPSDYSFALRDTLIRRGVNRSPSPSELRNSGLAAEVLLRLQFNLLLDEEARRMQLGADEDAALQLLRQDPLFHNINGAFDRNSFLSFLSQGGFSQAEVIENLRASARRNQLLDTITAGVKAPDVFYQASLLYERETRAIDYVRLDPSHIDKVEPPKDDILKAWFEEHTQEFRAPEYRTFTYMQLNAAMLAAPQNITETQLQDYYEANQQRFATPERRSFVQLRFNNRDEADAAHAKLAAGTDFEDLVREQGQDIEDIKRGPLSRTELPSLMAAELFSLTQDEVSPVINDLAGPVIVRVEAIQEAQIPPLETIAETLRQEMALSVANNTLRQTMRDIEEARFEGATLAELAEQYKLKLEMLTLDALGSAPAGQSDSLPDDFTLSETLLAQVFSSQVGIDRDPLLGQNDYIWYQLDAIIAARNLEFDEVVDDGVRPSWIAEEEDRLLHAKVEQLKIEIEGGKSLEQVAQENDLIVGRAAGLQRLSTNSDLGEDVIALVFDTPTGGVSKPINFIFPKDERQAAILFQVSDVAEPLSTDPQSLSEPQREALSARLSQDFVGQFVSHAMRDHAIEENSNLLAELLSDGNSLALR